MKSEIHKAVITAGGLGTRFLPATKAIPKEMLILVDKPVIQFVVEEAAAVGIEDIVIVTSKLKHAIEDHFDSNTEIEMALQAANNEILLEKLETVPEGVDIHFVRQRKPRGLGDAVLTAKRHIESDPFLVLLGDTVSASSIFEDDNSYNCSKPLVDWYNKRGKQIVAVERVPIEMSIRYGMIKGKKVRYSEGEVYKLEDMIEKPKPSESPSDLALWGRYLFEPSIFDYLENTEPGYNNEIQLTDAMRMSVYDGNEMYAYVLKNKRYDIGDKLSYLKAFVDFGLHNPETKKGFRAYLKSLKL
ncbi:UTP--glucose-1-phosphate uridylyltransferase [Candidatus Micrarchaeota archaeon]|nr:MAG: UTP--glucose-1-phosphate uridylyltransferase [Candidatus Micrarchaeota archaeon]